LTLTGHSSVFQRPLFVCPAAPASVPVDTLLFVEVENLGGSV
jgi:hypothetical protein